MYIIRNYKHSDFSLLDNWWKSYNEMGPIPEMMMEDTSFVLEINGVPALSITVYFTNCKEVAYIENFIGNPDLEGSLRKEASQCLLNHVYKFAKDKEYKRLVCFCYKDKLVKRYEELGVVRTLSGLHSFVKEL